MLKRRFCFQLTVAVLLSFSFGLSYSSPVQDSPGYSAEEALKVIRLIEKIQLEQLEKEGRGSSELRSVVVTESEFNSYIAYRIEVEKEEVMKELRLKFMEDNRIECMVVVDLRGQKLPKILKPRMTFFLGGELEVKEGNVRLNLEDLFLGTQRIQPDILDLVIFLGSKISGEEVFSMSNWWVLPYGIKDVKTKKGEARFYY
jgi:hypothetical protein